MKITEDRFSNGVFSKDRFVYSITVTEEEKQEILGNQEKAEILDIGQEDSIFKVAKFCETLADWKKENKQLKENGNYAFLKSMEWKLKCKELEEKLDKIKEGLEKGYYDKKSSVILMDILKEKS